MWLPSASSTAQTEIFFAQPAKNFTAALDAEPPRPRWPETKGQAQSLARGTGPSPAKCGQSRSGFQGAGHRRSCATAADVPVACPSCADSNGDSNSSDQRPTAATGDSA